MINTSEYCVDLYFFCEEVKKKREIANLFEYELKSNGPPDNDLLNSYYDEFTAKLEKIDSELKVDLNFFASVLFGANYGPCATCPSKKPASIGLLHDGDFGENSKKLIIFLCSLEQGLEVTVTIFKLNNAMEQWLCLKKRDGFETEARQFELDNGRENSDQLVKAANVFQWLQEDTSHESEEITYQEKYLRSLASKAGKTKKVTAPEAGENFETETVSLLKKHGLLSEAEQINNDGKFDACGFLESVLEDKTPNRVVSFPELQGGWYENKLVDEYASLITDFCKITRISIEELSLVPPLDENGEEDPYEDMSISFIHNGKKRKWTFNMETEEDYFRKFSKWAKSALKGGYMWFSMDYYRGYILPKALIEELYEIGIHGDK